MRQRLFILYLDILTKAVRSIDLKKEDSTVENTKEFVEKVQARQRNAELNKRRNGNGNPAERLANKKHSTNK